MYGHAHCMPHVCWEGSLPSHLKAAASLRSPPQLCTLLHLHLRALLHPSQTAVQQKTASISHTTLLKCSLQY